MAQNNINDIMLFLVVAKERSFTRAAAKLGISQSSLSRTVNALEERMGVRLLARTTRSVSPTAAGQQLLDSIAPHFDEIEGQIAAASELGDKPVGTIRITAIDQVINDILWPRLEKVLVENPDVRIELSSDYRMVDIAAERFDIGVRHGDQVEKDMIAVRLTPDVPTMIVGAPAYFARRAAPVSVQDLVKHNCINLRLASSGGIYAWELADGGRPVQARVSGQVVCTGVYQMLNAALSGAGLAFLTADMVDAHVREGRLVSVMNDCCPPFAGLHAYYSSRRHATRAFSLVIEAIRYVG